MGLLMWMNTSARTPPKAVILIPSRDDCRIAVWKVQCRINASSQLFGDKPLNLPYINHPRVRSRLM